MGLFQSSHFIFTVMEGRGEKSALGGFPFEKKPLNTKLFSLFSMTKQFCFSISTYHSEKKTHLKRAIKPHGAQHNSPASQITHLPQSFGFYATGIYFLVINREQQLNTLLPVQTSERKILYLGIYLIPQKDKKLEQYVTDTLPELCYKALQLFKQTLCPALRICIQTYTTTRLQFKPEQRFTLPAKVPFHLRDSWAGSFHRWCSEGSCTDSQTDLTEEFL